MARFQKGQSGNPGGRPSKQKMELRDLLDKAWPVKQREGAIKQLAAAAASGDLDAIRLLLAYTYGKPVDRKEITGADGDALSFKVYIQNDDFDPDDA